MKNDHKRCVLMVVLAGVSFFVLCPACAPTASLQLPSPVGARHGICQALP